MRTTIVTLFLAIVLGCNSDTSDNSNVHQASAARNSTAQWQRYNSNDKTFEVEFPSKPERWETEFEFPDFGHTDVYHVSAGVDGVMYGVNYNDYPRELSDAETDSELKYAYTMPDTGAEVLATSEVKVENVLAVEVISKMGPIYMVGRYFISDTQRLYSLQVGSERDPRDDREMIDHFFNSFKVTQARESESSDLAK